MRVPLLIRSRYDAHRAACRPTALFCLRSNLHPFLVALRASRSSGLRPPQWALDALTSRPSLAFGGALSGMSLFLEAKRRRGELAMYVLPKALESAWVMARGKGLVFRTGEYGQVLVRYCPLFLLLRSSVLIWR